MRAPDVAPAEYRLSAAGRTRAGALEPGETRVETVQICLAGGGSADIGLTGTTTATMAGVPLGPDVDETRAVGVGVGPIRIRALGEC